MNEKDFVQRGIDSWSRLRSLTLKIEASGKKAEDQDVLNFVDAYRSVSADLARARSETSNEELIESLNVVSTQAYATLYRRPGTKWWISLVSVFELCAQAFRRRFKAVLLAWLFMMIGVGVGFTTLEYRPDLRHHIVEPGEEELFEHWKEGEFDATGIDQATFMWSFYATNNPRVSAMAGALGASTGGIGSAWLMHRTGIQLGALSWEMNSVGKLGFLITSLMPHGASELSGAIIAAAAGLVFGAAILCPGRRKRGAALREVSKDGLALLGMGILMMFIAAPFEAFFSFRPEVPQSLKAAVGTIVFAIWVTYWTLGGRRSEPKPIVVSEMPTWARRKPRVVRGSSRASGLF